MAKSIFEVITDEIQTVLGGLEQSVSGGGAREYADYREMVGRIQALRSIRNYVHELSRNYLEQDND